jgi:hypothetical protein
MPRRPQPGDTRWAVCYWRDDMGREVRSRGLVIVVGALDVHGQLKLPEPYTGARPLEDRHYGSDQRAAAAVARLAKIARRAFGGDHEIETEEDPA